MNANPTARDVAEDLAGRMLSFFGAVNPTEEQRDELASELIRYGINWINDEFELGLR